MFKTPKFQLVELIVPTTAVSNIQTIYFQSQPQLQSVSGDNRVYIKAIEVFTSEQLIKSPLTAGNPVALPIDIANAVLTLSVNGSLDFQFVPLARLVNVQSNTAGSNTTNGHLWLLEDVYKIDWSKSYVQTIIQPGTGGTTVPPYSYFFGVHYGYLPSAQDIVDKNYLKTCGAAQGQGNPGQAWTS